MTPGGESGVLDRNGPLPIVDKDSFSWPRSASIDAGREAEPERAMKRPFNADRLVGEPGGGVLFREWTDRDENEKFSVTETSVTGLVTTEVEVVVP